MCLSSCCRNLLATDCVGCKLGQLLSPTGEKLVAGCASGGESLASRPAILMTTHCVSLLLGKHSSRERRRLSLASLILMSELSLGLPNLTAEPKLQVYPQRFRPRLAACGWFVVATCVKLGRLGVLGADPTMMRRCVGHLRRLELVRPADTKNLVEIEYCNLVVMNGLSCLLRLKWL